MLLASIHLETGKKGECLNKFFALITMLCLVLGFQNCSKSALQNSEGLDGNSVTVSLPSGNGSQSAAKVTYVEIPNADLSQAVSAAKASAAISSNRLVISVQSGIIQLMDDSNAVLEKRCLSSASLNELNTILSGSSVCAAKVASGDVCGMRYKEAYASLYADENRVKLGEEQDSCGTGRKDLCGEMANVFQNYVSHVKAHWLEMNCN